MSTQTTETSSQPKRRQKTLIAATKPSVPAEARRTTKVAAPSAVPQPDAPRTKQASALTLLSRADGATIIDLMEATGRQQHSVRGFLAGTVKKKLGLPLTSSKEDGALRRYRIVAKRGR